MRPQWLAGGHQPRRSAPPRLNSPLLTTFRLFSCASCSGCLEQAPLALRERSTPSEWRGHGEQHRRAAMHASKGAPAKLRAPSGAPHCGEHVGAHPVAVDLTAGEIYSSEVLLLSVTLTSGVGGPLSAVRRPRRVEIWVFLAFSSAVLK